MNNAIFTTDRLSVRRFTPDDSADLADILSDPEVTYFEPYPTFRREDCADEAVKLSESEEFYAVVLRDKVIGKIYFSRKGSGTYEIGYTFAKAYQRKGYATESIRAFFGYAFSELDVRRIIANIDTRNVRSFSLAERVGMRREATHREIFPRKDDENVFSDFYVYAILRSEFLDKD